MHRRTFNTTHHSRSIHRDQVFIQRLPDTGRPMPGKLGEGKATIKIRKVDPEFESA